MSNKKIALSAVVCLLVAAAILSFGGSVRTSTLSVRFLDGEVFYGLSVSDGIDMPLTRDSDKKISLSNIASDNQTAPLLISNKGRFIWCEDGFDATVKDGVITCVSQKRSVSLYESPVEKTLKGAYLAASAGFFPPDGVVPDETLFRVPQYDTWIALGSNQTQKGVEEFAQSIADSSMPVDRDGKRGVLTIDDGWQKNYGDWRFDEAKFPDPKAMFTKLQNLGFKVVLWIAPFVDQSAPAFKELRNSRLLVRDAFGGVAYRQWWNDYDNGDALLDMSNPKTAAWLQGVCDGLTEQYGVAGFKLDGGDPKYYRAGDKTYGNADANTQSYLWTTSVKSPVIELRASFKAGGVGVVQRLSDKRHEWGESGLASVVPNSLSQGILGYSFTVPDMIGGGQIADFSADGGADFSQCDGELLIRYAQAAAFMPIMQFSIPVWTLSDGRQFGDNSSSSVAELCRRAAASRTRGFSPQISNVGTYEEYIILMAKRAAETGEPIIRYLEYEFPNQGFETEINAFMLGKDFLVSPVLEKGQYEKTIRLPNGKWRFVGGGDDDGTVYTGGQSVTVKTPLIVIPIFQKIS